MFANFKIRNHIPLWLPDTCYDQKEIEQSAKGKIIPDFIEDFPLKQGISA